MLSIVIQCVASWCRNWWQGVVRLVARLAVGLMVRHLALQLLDIPSGTQLFLLSVARLAVQLAVRLVNRLYNV